MVDTKSLFRTSSKARPSCSTSLFNSPACEVGKISDSVAPTDLESFFFRFSLAIALEISH